MLRAWTFADFILVWLGGFLGTGFFFALGSLQSNEDLTFVLALAGQYIGNLGVLWLISRRKENRDLGFSIEGGDVFYIGLGLGLQFVMALLMLPVSQWLFPDGPPSQDVADMLADRDTSTMLQMSLILAAVLLAPVTEELLFRGVLLRSFSGRSHQFVILATALIFAAVHLLEFVGQDQLIRSAAVILPPIFILGLILARITLRTGRLGPAIFIHSGWNLLAALVLLIPQDLLDRVVEAAGG